MLAVKQYTEFILKNNKLLEKAYKKLYIITGLMAIVVCLSFIEYILLSFY